MADVDNDEALLELEFLSDEEDEYNLVNADEDALLADDSDLLYKKISQKEEEILEDTDKTAKVDDILHISNYEEELDEEHDARLTWDARQRLNNRRGISEFNKVPHISRLRSDDNGMLPPMNRPQNYETSNQIFPPQQQQPPPPQVSGNSPSQFGQQIQFMGLQYNPTPYYTPNTTPYQAPVQNNFVQPPPARNNFEHPPLNNPGLNPHPSNFSQPRNEIVIFGSQHHGYQQIPNKVSVYSRVGMKTENIRRRTDLPFVQRKKRFFSTNSNLQEVRTFELPKLVEINKVQEIKPVEEVKIEDKDEEIKAYLLQIHKQKELREKILREKEARRIQAAKQDSSLAVNTLQSLLNTNTLVSPSKGTQISTVLANDEALEDTHVVIVSNLAVETTEIKLRKMGQGIGIIQKFEMSPEERQATITFECCFRSRIF